jgi:hypothetical protein
MLFYRNLYTFAASIRNNVRAGRLGDANISLEKTTIVARRSIPSTRCPRHHGLKLSFSPMSGIAARTALNCPSRSSCFSFDSQCFASPDWQQCRALPSAE